VGRVLLVELVPERGHLAVLELGGPDRPPALGSTGHGAEHQLHDRFFTERNWG
jgi:hypothetical protein